MNDHLGNHISYLSNNTRYTRIFGWSHLDVGGGTSVTGMTAGISEGVGDGDDGGHLKPYKLSLATKHVQLVLLIQLVLTKYKLTINRKN